MGLYHRYLHNLPALLSDIAVDVVTLSEEDPKATAIVEHAMALAAYAEDVHKVGYGWRNDRVLQMCRVLNDDMGYFYGRMADVVKYKLDHAIRLMEQKSKAAQVA